MPDRRPSALNLGTMMSPQAALCLGCDDFVRGKNEHLLDASRRRSFYGEVASISLDLTLFSNLVGSS
jgi:hypothetical protein